MRLLLINSIGRKKWGGGEKWMLLAASELIKKGHHVVIGCRKKSIIEQRAKELQIQVVNLDIYTDFSFIGFFQLREAIKKEQIDLVIGCQNKDVRVAGFTSNIIKGPPIISRQGVQLLSNSSKYKWTFLPFCDGIITNTYSIKKEYDSYGWWNDDFVKVVFNGININGIGTEPMDISTIIPHSEKKPFVIVSTGRLAKQKGVEYLIEAAKPIVDQYPHVHFIWAGQGKLESALRTKIANLNLALNFHLIGFQKNVSSLLKAADLFVLPSLYEGMPNSLMEALAHGLPAVSTNVNGVNELMIEEEHGVITNAGDSEVLQKAIIEMLNNKDLRKLGENAKHHVSTTFSIERMANDLESYLLQLIQKRSI